MERLAGLVSLYLLAQVGAGAQVVQIFDSWAGILSPSDYIRYAQPYSRTVLDHLSARGIPSINFSTGTSAYVEAVAEAGGQAVGIDWRSSLAESWSRIGHDRAVQGNLDPMVVAGPIEAMEEQALHLLASVEGRSGHIFNLGHGVHPSTPVENLQRLVDLVHNWNPTHAERAIDPGRSAAVRRISQGRQD